VLVVCLPTGDGKSFVFQVIASCGFLGDEAIIGEGVTLVVTPTVALAQDHEHAALELGFPEQPRAYVGGSAITNASIREAVAAGAQGLVFASPEAVCGPLRGALVQAAQLGLLRAFVVDEAHLVDAWGAEFRPEFQVLAGIRRELLQASSGRLRTVLLSATYTQAAIDTLRAFFSVDDKGQACPFAVVAATRLRPEPDYWVAPVSGEALRDERVMDAVLHLPRPLVLYTTRVDDAERWRQRLWDQGFRRLACVTGKTPASDRNRAVHAWRREALDLVVATSAFGLGIDNPHVRAVIHACIPETLDRFYQEVGRGGRDGRASLSLLLPTMCDFEMATGLNRKKIITIDLGLPRWRAMFYHREKIDHGADEYTVRLDIPPGNDARQIDMDNRENTEWNQRTLTLMAGAGLLSLVGPVTSTPRNGRDVERADDPSTFVHSFQTVHAPPGHAERDTWERLVEPRRAVIAASSEATLRAMEQYARGATTQCVADVLTPLYTVAAEGDFPGISVGRACGGCPSCRAKQRPPFEEPVGEPLQPWPARATLWPDILAELDSAHRLLVFYGPEDLRGSRLQRRFIRALARLIRAGFTSLLSLDGFELDPAALAESVGTQPWFLSERWPRHHLPAGPKILLTSPKTRLSNTMWMARNEADARVVVLPTSARDPELPEVPLSRRYVGRQLTLLELVERLAR
jgi:superfamily II DNA/RNA helicase